MLVYWKVTPHAIRPLPNHCCGTGWATTARSSALSSLKPGINQVEIRWPYRALLQAQDGATALATAVARLDHRFKDGKIVEAWGLSDELNWYKQLEVALTPLAKK